MIRSILLRAGIILDTAVSGAVYILASPFDINGKICDIVTRIWARIILYLCGIKVNIIGIDNIKKNNSYIIVSNHQSHFDIPALNAYFPLSVRMIAKKELFRIPIFGWAMYLAGHISLDRGKGKKALKSLRKAIDRIRKKNFSIVVYPEGTRSPDGEIHPFKNGAFRLAVEANLPVLPVTIIGTRQILPKHSTKINKGNVTVIVGKPLVTEGMEKRDIPSLKDRVYNEIVNSFKKHSI